MLRRTFCKSLPIAALSASTLTLQAARSAGHRSESGGWILVRLSGSPADVGFQHGAALAQEIEGVLKSLKVLMPHDSGKDWNFFREAAQKLVWPKVEQEYRDELKGIVDGAASKGAKFDLWDVVVLNANQELTPYYTEWYDKQHRKQSTPEHCSAFVATGSWTTDGRPVLAHNCWTDYAIGARWNVIFDVRPAKGHRFLMDVLPGMIHSGDDFGINGAGLMISETTIGGFHGFDPDGTPEFVRARRSMQYAGSIDDYVTIMKTGNNGGYANTWLVADRKTGEIANLELGLKHVTLDRTRDGYFVGSNYPLNPELIRDETDFDPKNMGASANARRKRWEALMAEYKGRIDVDAAKRFLADHVDTFDNKTVADERTLCGHNEDSPRGMGGWQPPYGAAGAVQSKVADGKMAEELALWAAMGHACGVPFKAKEHLTLHPELAWQKDILIDLLPGPWTRFQAAE
jgi:hypothetical protein